MTPGQTSKLTYRGPQVGTYMFQTGSMGESQRFRNNVYLLHSTLIQENISTEKLFLTSADLESLKY